MNNERYEIRFQLAARRAIAERLPESVAAAVLEFCAAALALGPRRVGKPLFGPLTGCHGARRGTYRVAYRIDEQAHVIEVLDIHHRADIYRRSLRRHEAQPDVDERARCRPRFVSRVAQCQQRCADQERPDSRPRTVPMATAATRCAR